jgi:D-amino-acid oxidase
MLYIGQAARGRIAVHLDRRTLLAGGLTSLLALRPNDLWADQRRTLLPEPLFPGRSAGPAPFTMVVGRRPVREAGFRLERVNQGARILIHNYGHGGGGITLAPGCARLIVDDYLRGVDRHSSVAVLGAGIVGLTAAAALRRAGFPVTVYSDILPGDPAYDYVTSSLAGGQFAPSFTYADTDRRMAGLLRASAAHYRQAPLDWGVTDRDNYTVHESERELGPATRALGNEPVPLTVLPFRGLQHQSGYLYKTLLIEPPRYLRGVYASLIRPEPVPVRFRRLSIDGAAKIFALDEPIIVNCLGLNGGLVFGLDDVKPVAGLLVRLPAQPNLRYLYSGVGYVFPRSDYLVVGGTTYFPGGKNANGKHEVAEDGWKLIDSARATFRGDCPDDFDRMSGHDRRTNLFGCTHEPK